MERRQTRHAVSIQRGSPKSLLEAAELIRARSRTCKPSLAMQMVTPPMFRRLSAAQRCVWPRLALQITRQKRGESDVDEDRTAKHTINASTTSRERDDFLQSCFYSTVFSDRSATLQTGTAMSSVLQSDGTWRRNANHCNLRTTWARYYSDREGVKLTDDDILRRTVLFSEYSENGLLRRLARERSEESLSF
jgi:hypothetical protein